MNLQGGRDGKKGEGYMKTRMKEARKTKWEEPEGEMQGMKGWLPLVELQSQGTKMVD